jgi:16S rRNA (adenine1518-N6/adenine1519-N6)-dimethyltransferase
MISEFRPNKNLSQNFLVDPNIARKIVGCMNIQHNDSIIEIGAGRGALTGYLLQSPAKKITAVELDARLITDLRSQFGHHRRFILIHQDFLKFEFHSMTSLGHKFRLIGNLPYSITSPLLFYIFDHREYVQDMVLMLQKEVGMRLSASPCTKAYGIPSVLFQAVSTIENLFHVPPSAFRPVPDVESTVLHIKFDRKTRADIPNWNLFVNIVRTAFNQRRKMLRNTLGKWISKDTMAPVDLTRRPEQLTVEEWAQLSRTISDISGIPPQTMD